MRKLKNAELNRIDLDSFKQAPKSPLILVLDNVRSTHNVGSIFRKKVATTQGFDYVMDSKKKIKIQLILNIS